MPRHATQTAGQRPKVEFGWRADRDKREESAN